MGVLVSRFRRAKPSTIQQLETLEKDMTDLEERSERTQRLQRLWIGRLIFYSSAAYIVAAAFLWFWSFPKEWMDWIFAALPLLLFPVLVWLLKRFMSWWFVRRTQSNYAALEGLKEKKRKILEEVMEKETYKTAKEILERFDSEAKKAKELEQAAIAAASVGQELRQRTPSQRGVNDPPAVSSPLGPHSGPQMQTPGRGPPGPPLAGRGGTPTLPSTPGGPGTAPGGPPEKGLLAGVGGASGALARRPSGHVAATPAAAHAGFFPPPHLGMHPPGPPLPRPVLPRERGVADRVIEYLVGDGPQNRYALICQQCFSHNGMALREEFEYIAYRCAYCFSLNPARRTRPIAPRFGDSGAQAQPQSRPGFNTAATAAGPAPTAAGADGDKAAPAVGDAASDVEVAEEELPHVAAAPSAAADAAADDDDHPASEEASPGFVSLPEGDPVVPQDETDRDGASTAESVSPASLSDVETLEAEPPATGQADKSADESMDVS